MRRVLTQVAEAAVRSKGSIFDILYRRWVAHMGHNRAIWAVAHRICRLTWKILHQGVSYQERGRCPDAKVVRKRTTKLVRQLRALGYTVQLTPTSAPVTA